MECCISLILSLITCWQLQYYKMIWVHTTYSGVHTYQATHIFPMQSYCIESYRFIISPYKVFGVIMVLASPPRPHPQPIVVHGHDRPPRAPPPPQERMRPILFCSWDLSEHEKWMPPSPNWDGLLVGRHFQNGRHRN